MDRVVPHTCQMCGTKLSVEAVVERGEPRSTLQNAALPRAWSSAPRAPSMWCRRRVTLWDRQGWASAGLGLLIARVAVAPLAGLLACLLEAVGHGAVSAGHGSRVVPGRDARAGVAESTRGLQHAVGLGDPGGT